MDTILYISEEVNWTRTLLPRRHSLKMGYRYVCRRPLLHTLLAINKSPISPFFSSQDPSFTHKSQISRNFKLQSLKISKAVSVSKPQIGPKNQFTWLHFVKKLSSLGFKIWQWSFTSGRTRTK